MKKLLSISIFILVITHIIGQEYTVIKDVEEIEKHKYVLEREYPLSFDSLKIHAVYKIDDKHSKITYSEKGVYSEVTVNSAKKDLLIIAKAVEIPNENVPKVVMDGLKESKYGDWEIDKTFKVRKPFTGWFYGIDVSKNDEYLRVYYDELGQYQQAPY
ncbi:MAG: hypothetical protein ACOCUL_03520 [Bacteroidota bacterium]